MTLRWGDEPVPNLWYKLQMLNDDNVVVSPQWDACDRCHQRGPNDSLNPHSTGSCECLCHRRCEHGMSPNVCKRCRVLLRDRGA